ncbi:MAG: CidA/LrgA family protein [Oscillospiraceae bacterium]|nr:CidA/LrgA family protein [Oscillospiraceae bacterium]MBQ3880324.1 CidA/LrgA family protein [Oscillospiraceae bacterium]
MKYIRQLALVLAVSFLGEILNRVIPLPIPASIYGLVMMFLLLESGLVKFEKVEATTVFLKNTLVVTLIPSAVGVMAAWDVLEPILLPAVLIIVVTNVLVLAVSGHVSQAIVRMQRAHREKKMQEAAK